MARIVMAAPLDLARSHRQQRLGAVKRLNLRLLVHAQDQGVHGWRQIEADNVAHLFDEERIRRQLERRNLYVFWAMGLKAKSPPDPMDRRRGIAHGPGHGVPRPMGRPERQGLQRAPDGVGNRRIPDLARRAGPGRVVKPVHPM